MDWKNLPSGGNIEDARGGGGLPGGGVAVGGIGGIVLLLLSMFLGVDLTGLGGGHSAPPQTQTRQVPPEQQDEEFQFVDKVKASTDQTWTKIFGQAGRRYQQPNLRLFNGYTNGACGQASSATGPFYCPLDNKVYLDTSFFNQMQQRLGGGGDFAYSYVIAHEVGHHVQNELGILEQVQRRQQAARSKAEANSYEVRLELQADCFAGVWGNSVSDQVNLTEEDVREAINTAKAIGDDTLQRQSTGRVMPDSFTHGTSEQRTRWFMKGLQSGNPEQCDSFSAPYNQL